MSNLSAMYGELHFDDDEDVCLYLTNAQSSICIVLAHRKSAVRHIAPFGHIILILSQYLF